MAHSLHRRHKMMLCEVSIVAYLAGAMLITISCDYGNIDDRIWSIESISLFVIEIYIAWMWRKCWLWDLVNKEEMDTESILFYVDIFIFAQSFFVSSSGVCRKYSWNRQNYIYIWVTEYVCVTCLKRICIDRLIHKYSIYMLCNW